MQNKAKEIARILNGIFAEHTEKLTKQEIFALIKEKDITVNYFIWNELKSCLVAYSYKHSPTLYCIKKDQNSGSATPIHYMAILTALQKSRAYQQDYNSRKRQSQQPAEKPVVEVVDNAVNDKEKECVEYLKSLGYKLLKPTFTEV